MNKIQLEDAVENIMETFYEEVCFARGKAAQDVKKKAVAAIIALGKDKVYSTKKVQAWFEAIREQQRG